MKVFKNIYKHNFIITSYFILNFFQKKPPRTRASLILKNFEKRRRKKNQNLLISKVFKISELEVINQKKIKEPPNTDFILIILKILEVEVINRIKEPPQNTD